MEGVPTLTAAGDQEHLKMDLSERVFNQPRSEMYEDSFTLMGQGDKTEGVGTLSAAGDIFPLEWRWTSPEDCVAHPKENVEARKWEKN